MACLVPDLEVKIIKIVGIMKEAENLQTAETQALNIPVVSNRFSIFKTILSDFALFAIIDNEQNKVVCHLVYDNGEQYCDEMANKILTGLNGC